MKILVVSLVVAGLLISSAGMVMVLVLARDSGPAPRIGSDIREARLDRFGEEIASLRRELANIADRVQGLEAGIAALPEESGASEATRPESEIAPARPAPAATENPPLAADHLRDLVFSLIEEERKVRQEEQVAQSRERARQWEELRKGPYGKYNFQVNSLGEQLGLNDFQRNRYHELLVWRDERMKELRVGIDWSDQVSREAYQQKTKELKKTIDSEFTQVLTPEQADQYEKSRGRITFSATPFYGVEGGSITVDSVQIGE